MNPQSKREENAKLLSGNEAIAYGAMEAGVAFCTSYPGTPSTEIMETLMVNAEAFALYTEWSTNEKVALEASAGASWMGIPSICSMKSLGLNVAADFLLNLNLSGSGPGGLVIVVCDDPRGHSSSNEQDSRFYAKAAKLPLIEPTDCQEAKDVMPFAFELSRRHQIPIIVRSTTRLSHSRGLVRLGDIEKHKIQANPSIPDNLFNVPNPHIKHKDLDEKLGDVLREFENSEFNSCSEEDGSNLIIIASGIGYRYAMEAIEILGINSTRVVKIVTTYPLPEKIIQDWWNGNKKILFIEEIDPFVEEQVLAIFAEFEWLNSVKEPVEFYGKRNGFVPFYGELNTDIVVDSIAKVLDIQMPFRDDVGNARKEAKDLLIERPLTFCAGCTHRNVYYAIKRVKHRLKDKIIVAGDIGCYSLGVFYDQTMDTMQAMGSGIGVATGLGQLQRFDQDNKILAVAGDSTFYHSCIPGLINARHKNADLTFLILDNSTTAMTGFQEHPGSATQSKNSKIVSIAKIVKAIEPDLFEEVNSEEIDSLIDSIHRAVDQPGLKVLHLKGICRLEAARSESIIRKVEIDTGNCKGSTCKICVSDFGCTGLRWINEDDRPEIVDHICIHCGACISVCPNNAIRREEGIR